MALARRLGIHPEVSTELMALTSLLPPDVGSPFRQHQPDALHVIPRVFCVFLKLLDHVLGSHTGPRATYRSREDVRHEIERRLAAVPPMQTPFFRLRPFSHGWWAESRRKMSCEEWISLFSQVLPCYGGDSDMLPDAPLRKRLTGLHRDLYRYYRELHTPCFRTEEQLGAVDALRDSVKAQLLWFQAHVARGPDTGLGDLFDTPKVTMRPHARPASTLDLTCSLLFILP